MFAFSVAVARLTALIAVAIAFVPRARAMDAAESCAVAAEAAQDLRRESKLSAAHAKLVACSGSVCPGVVRKDCVRWLTEVEAALPSLIVRAQDGAGRELTNIRILSDGVVLTQALGGTAMAVDPGSHELSFVLGDKTIKKTLLIREGEKGRSVNVRFPGIRPSTWVMGAFGLAIAGLGTAYDVRAKVDYNRLRDGWGKTGTCTDAQVDPVRTKLLIGDTLLGVGVVALGIATWRFIVDRSDALVSDGPTAGPSPWAPSLAMVNGGLSATCSFRF